MTEPPTPFYGDFQEENDQLLWWNGEKWLPVVQHYDRDAIINDLRERVSKLEARLDKEDEYQQEQGEWQ